MPTSFMPIAGPGDEPDPATSVRTTQSGTWGFSYLAPNGYLGTRAEIERELDHIAADIRSFPEMMPDQVMRYCSAFSARLTELAVLLHRVESHDRQYTRIRTQQVERFIGELDRQFRVASRLVEVQRQDLDLMRG